MPHSNRGGVSDKTVPRPEPHTPEAEADPAGIGDVEATGTHEPAPVRPTLTARKDEWADYVEALGLDAEPDATKTRLIELADEAEARAGGTE